MWAKNRNNIRSRPPNAKYIAGVIMSSKGIRYFCFNHILYNDDRGSYTEQALIYFGKPSPIPLNLIEMNCCYNKQFTTSNIRSLRTTDDITLKYGKQKNNLFSCNSPN